VGDRRDAVRHHGFVGVETVTRRAPVVRRVNMLSEYHPEDHGRTQGFFRALSEADGFIHDKERGDEALVRVDELTQLVADIKELHKRERAFAWTDVDACATCRVVWPCKTIKLIEGDT
jgi:hypothetical protein